MKAFVYPEQALVVWASRKGVGFRQGQWGDRHAFRPRTHVR
jgi:hypothetical protein